MNILEALKNDNVKVTKAAGFSPYSHQDLGRKEQRRSRQETACLRKCTGQDVEGTEGALGKGESH
ncbi:MAG: hypothetical protein DMG42_02010 [Acidobacteria bacterium]|nr:MAG: hypothetical protein AUH13_05565 [Acidobacteria bacterium 13_2_20CM_58_27]PYT77733.1 MAG: hypothetical protein DMG42_02010 [Acidobacteriota bacterium]